MLFIYIMVSFIIFKKSSYRFLKGIFGTCVTSESNKDKQLNQLGSCSKCDGQRCGLCKIDILAETNKFLSFTVRFKYRIFRPLKLYFCKRYLQNRLRFM